jgi:hypothetical protein
MQGAMRKLQRVKSNVQATMSEEWHERSSVRGTT